MQVILDTHVLLWAVLNDPRLSDTQARAISEGEVYISSASVWEIGIKRTIGKLDIPNEFFEIAVDAGCRPLPISRAHAEAAGALPLHHTDPFDRILVAQARYEGLSLASSDTKLGAYVVDLVG